MQRKKTTTKYYASFRFVQAKKRVCGFSGQLLKQFHFNRGIVHLLQNTLFVINVSVSIGDRRFIRPCENVHFICTVFFENSVCQLCEYTLLSL